MANPWIPFNNFFQDLGRAVNNLNSNEVAIYLTDATPNVATNKVKADLAEIATGNGYTGPINIHNAYAQSGGVATMTGDASETITATGPITQFRYAVMYNATVSGGPLIAYYDYGSEVNLVSPNTFTINFPPAIITVQQG